ncbi:hypothetical protein [Ornithinibacillus sp. 179-J 7C1 HS]|uniref:hypothetical protein n=1 Tax=Ornithinibacillus sp. 179-J 7C1 HS TaxID=3142384 RepID=UPI0039A1DD66
MYKSINSVLAVLITGVFILRIIKYSLLVIVIVAVGAIWFFNISLTSLPTTFSSVLKEELTNNDHIVFDIDNIDYERIQNLEIKKAYEGEPVLIEDKDAIQSILNRLFHNDLRIYDGGRIDFDSIEYDLSINFYGYNYRIIVGDDYIHSNEELYKVLDEQNDLYDYVESLYSEKESF